MQLESNGILIGLRPFGERDFIAHIFTRDFGVMVGMLRGAAVAKKNKPLIGQVGTVSWVARLDSQLGAFHWESSRNLAAQRMSDMAALSQMNSVFALIQTLLPEREQYEKLYDRTIQFLEGFVGDFYPPLEGGSKSQSDFGVGLIANQSEYSGRGYTNRTLANAQNLRKTMTDAERLLWHYLGRYKNHLGFSRQRPIGKYIVDFINFEKKIIVELDGAQHGEELNHRYDVIRDDFLSAAGYIVLRFWNDEVFKEMDMVLRTIYCYFEETATRFLTPPRNCKAISTRPQGAGKNPTDITQSAIRPQGAGKSPTDTAQDDTEDSYLNWEIDLLRELGYALDLSRCSGCGSTENLNFLSPKTGRAVCAQCAAPYIGRLFELPITPTTTEKFLMRICDDMGVKMPMARKLVNV